MRRVDYKASVGRDLRRLDRHVARRVIDRIESQLASDDLQPIPLNGPFEGLFKLRVGDYRVIYTLADGNVVVLRVAHRSDAYR